MADIPRQRLNVDDRGFAGPMLPDLAGPAMGGAAAGIPREFMQMLAEAHAMRQRQAAMQLRLMGEDIRNQRFDRDAARRAESRMRTPIYQPHGGGRVPREISSEELGRSLAASTDTSRSAARFLPEQLRDVGNLMKFLGPKQLGANQRQAGAGFANLAGQASANAPALASMQGPDQGPYSFLGTAGRNERADPRFTAGQTRSKSVGGRRGMVSLPSNEKGTLPGTVPKTGTYRLHKDEIVVSAPQVAPGGELDSQLMNALIEDKMRKGITGKNPKGNSYRGGSFGYAMPGLGAEAAALGLDIYGTRREPMGPPEPAGPSFLESIPGRVRSAFSTLAEGGMPVTPGGLRLPAMPFLAPGFEEDEVASALPPREDFGSQSTSPSRGDLMGRSAAGPEIPENLDLAVALERTRGGDLGTRENPLTLSGSSGLGPNSAGITAPPEGRGDEHIPEAERYFAPESAEWRKAQSQQIMATQNRQKADRIRDYLLSEGENMDSDTRKDLMKGADWLDSTADMVEQRFETAKEKRLDRIDAANESLLNYQTEMHKAAAADDEKARSRADAEFQKLKQHYNDLEKMYVNPKNADGREEILGTMARSIMEIGKSQGQRMNVEQAKVIALVGMGKIEDATALLEDQGASPEEIQEFLAQHGGG